MKLNKLFNQSIEKGEQNAKIFDKTRFLDVIEG